MQKQDYYNNFFEIGQQKINFSFFELSLPDDDPVYTLKKVLEELDFSGLLACYSDKGRTGFNPIMLYSVVSGRLTVSREKSDGRNPGCIELSVYAPPTKGWTRHTQPQEIAN